MRLSLPRQALCQNRSQLTHGPNPSQWILAALPKLWRIHSFHFFVNWSVSPLTLDNTVWMTRILELEDSDSLETIKVDEVVKAFRRAGYSKELESLNSFCDENYQQVTSIILPEVPPNSLRPNTPIWKLKLATNGTTLHCDAITLDSLMHDIQCYSGGSVNVGKKGLIYGTSAIECYLSHTSAAYPGDVDAIVIGADNRPRYIFEFKKHTLAEPIGSHLVTRYYPRPDGRKYDRLNLLAEHYQKQSAVNVPLVILYYSTKNPLIRVQKVRRFNGLRAEIDHDSGDIDIKGLREDGIGKLMLQEIGRPQ